MITMMYDVLVIGSNMMELTTEIDRMPQLGETVAAPNFHMAFGGKGANQAVAAAKLGAKVAMISKVGADSLGQAYVAHFKQHQRGQCRHPIQRGRAVLHSRQYEQHYRGPRGQQ